MIEEISLADNESPIVSDLRDYEKYLRNEVVKSEGLSSEVYFRGRADGVNDCIAKLRAMEPVSVDAIAALIEIDPPYSPTDEYYATIIKAVLDGAGVKHVD